MELHEKYVELLECQQDQMKDMVKALRHIERCHDRLGLTLQKARREPSAVTKNWLSNLYRGLEYAKHESFRAKRTLTQSLET
jgi:hypothetical protein